MAGQRIKDNELLIALSNSKNVKECAISLQITPQAIYKRMRNKTFANKLNDIRNKKFEIASSQIADITSTAINTLREIIEDNSINPGVRVRACNSILNAGLRFNEQQEIINRLIEIESRLD